MKFLLDQPYHLHSTAADLYTRSWGRLGTLSGQEWPNAAAYWPGIWSARLSEAQTNHYSVPLDAYQAGTGAGIRYVNPDGTVGLIFNWGTWPLQVYTGPAGTAMPNGGNGWVWDTSWVAPPQSVWNAYMVSLGVQSLADQQAAAVAAAQAAAQADAATAAPGVLPSQYNPNPANRNQANPRPNSVSSTVGNLSFITSRGGFQLQPGDTWTIQITGAAPNQSVSVLGIHPDGQSANNTMGNTDPQGAFSLSGTIDATSMGSWQETWMVGGQTIGHINFSVVPVGTASGSAGGGVSPPPGGKTGPPPPPTNSFLDSLGLGSVPKGVLVGAAAVAALLLLGGRR